MGVNGGGGWGSDWGSDWGGEKRGEGELTGRFRPKSFLRISGDGQGTLGHSGGGGGWEAEQVGTLGCVAWRRLVIGSAGLGIAGSRFGMGLSPGLRNGLAEAVGFSAGVGVKSG